jgi:hypothetical protein
VLIRCEIVLGDSEEHITNAFLLLKSSKVNKLGMEEMLDVLQELKTIMSLR